MTNDTRALEVRARQGDVAAQFELAALLDRMGHRIAATSWLEAAGNNGHLEALAVLAFRDLQGLEMGPEPARARERLERAVSLGGNTARRMLATLTATGVFGAPDWRRAVGLTIDAAKGDDWQALRHLAFLVERAAPGSPIAEGLLLRAALLGCGLSVFAVLRRIALHGRPFVPEETLAEWRAAVRRIGHPLAERVSHVVAPAEAAKALEGQPDFAKIAALLQEAPGLNVAAPTPVESCLSIRKFDRLLSVEECEYLIGMSARLLGPAAVVERTTLQGQPSGLRTNSVAALWPVQQDMIVHSIDLRLSKAAGMAYANGEMINVLMYRPGEEYRPHCDFFAPEIAARDPSGQRVRTLLVWLNDDFGGGETQFVHAGLKVKGGVGDAILFDNVKAATGGPDPSTLHAGLPVTSGQKWLVSKWFREKKFVV